jgi:polyribonucleotide nucleotidyltransferase
MDFKVAGTEEGITALQLDVKKIGLTPAILAKAFKRAKKARLFILDKMNKVISSPKDAVSQYAPVVKVMEIKKEDIGNVIGPGGKTIRKIIEQTEATVDIDDDGKVTISALNKESMDEAVEWIEGLTKEVEVGEIYDGKVKKILPFGAFVEILPKKEGLVHVSKMAERYVEDPKEIVSVGDEVKVKVVEIDKKGRINLSMKF